MKSNIQTGLTMKFLFQGKFQKVKTTQFKIYINTKIITSIQYRNNISQQNKQHNHIISPSVRPSKFIRKHFVCDTINLSNIVKGRILFEYHIYFIL